MQKEMFQLLVLLWSLNIQMVPSWWQLWQTATEILLLRPLQVST